jgi:hypothetical protein
LCLVSAIFQSHQDFQLLAHIHSIQVFNHHTIRLCWERLIAEECSGMCVCNHQYPSHPRRAINNNIIHHIHVDPSTPASPTNLPAPLLG